MEYTFNTKVLFLLLKFVKHFSGQIDIIKKIILEGTDDVSEFLDVVFAAIGVLPEVEEISYELLALSTRRSVSEIEKMDGYQFIKEFKEFLFQLNWEKLLGESLGLAVVKNQ